MVVAETLVHRSRIHQQSKNNVKESASCEEPSSSNSNSSDGDEDGRELTPELIKYCGWYDGCDDVSPHPTVCQIGSNSPTEAAFAIRVAQKCGYDG